MLFKLQVTPETQDWTEPLDEMVPEAQREDQVRRVKTDVLAPRVSRDLPGKMANEEREQAG